MELHTNTNDAAFITPETADKYLKRVLMIN